MEKRRFHNGIASQSQGAQLWYSQYGVGWLMCRMAVYTVFAAGSFRK